jgi:hypothetical protein
VKKVIEVDLFDTNREGNQKFFRLLDSSQWDILREKLKSPDNKLTIEQLIGKLLEGTL